MPRNVTVTFDDGSQHVYQGVPDAATPDQVEARAQQDFGKGVTGLDGGAGAPRPRSVNVPVPTAGQNLRAAVEGTPAFAALDTAGGIVAGAPGAAAHAGVDLYRRLTGGDTSAPDPAWVRAMQYQPQQGTQDTMAALAASRPVQAVAGAARAADASLGRFSPTLQDVVHQAGGVAQDVGAIAPVAAGARALGAAAAAPLAARSARLAALPKTAEDVLARTVANSPNSTSAAAAAPSLQGVSPELRQAIVETARSNGGAVNPEALQRHIQADTLPVPVRLTAGQATQDPEVISQERNMRGGTDLVNRYNQQNRGLAENLQALRDQVGPDVFTTNQVEHGQALIDAYKAKDAAAQADIRGKYQALADANGGDLPVDGSAFVQQAAANLKKQMKAPFLPSPVVRVLSDIKARGGQMTMEQFENLRTTLAAEARKADRAADGNAGAAVGAVRDALENLPIQSGEHIVMEGRNIARGDPAQIKQLADAARGAAKARFDALRADPAYAAAVDDKVTPDRFVSRFVVSGAKKDLATMRQNLADNPTAVQTISVAALDHLRDQAKVGPNQSGNFASASFGKALQGLDPKMESLVDPRTAETLQQLGDVARYVQAQPAGSYVNNSNTLTALASKAAGGAIAHAVGAVPGGRFMVGAAQGAKEAADAARAMRKALAPGAGLDHLPPPSGMPRGAAPVGAGTVTTSTPSSGSTVPSASPQQVAAGAAAMARVIASKASAPNAMSRPGLGSVSFHWGQPGNPAKDFAGGSGVSHIIAKRTAEGADGVAVAHRMVDVIAHGQVGPEYGPTGAKRVNITLGDASATLSKYKDGKLETWLLTGWDEPKGRPDDTGGRNPPGAYAPQPRGIGAAMGAGTANSTTTPAGEHITLSGDQAATEAAPINHIAYPRGRGSRRNKMP